MLHELGHTSFRPIFHFILKLFKLRAYLQLVLIGVEKIISKIFIQDLKTFH